MRERPDKSARLNEILDSISKPLQFASKDDFSHMNALKGLETLIAKLCDDAFLLAAPPESARFPEIKKLFARFDSLAIEKKRDAVTNALSLIDSIRQVKIKRPRLMSEAISPEEAIKRIKAIKAPLSGVKEIGPKLAARLDKKGLSTIEDLLYFLPIRYEDRRNIKKINELSAGQTAVVAGEVLAFGEVFYGRRRVFEMALSDGSGILRCKWFNFRSSYMKDRFRQKDRVLAFGSVGAFGGRFEMIHPDMEFLGDGDDGACLEGITPVYSQVENFHQKTIRKIVKGVVDSHADFAISGVPDEIIERYGFLKLSEALKKAHEPKSISNKAPEAALKSLAFDELFMLELGLGMKRAKNKKEAGLVFENSFNCKYENKLIDLLPFKLTRAQEKTLSEIKKDMAAPHPMNRLIQGDVGSGKTIVSFISALIAIEAGFQAAIMAPTEILAEQHFLNFHKYAETLGVKAALLTGSLKKKERDILVAGAADGELDLIIGTHALIQKDVEFANLGLAIIDEQHRFGVAQRGLLRKKRNDNAPPDMLVMTATPIPRTLSMTVFGDLDVSIIDELPPGRTPVLTKILREKDRARAYEAIRKEIKEGRQAYIVYPLVEESEELSLKDATTMKERLEKEVFSDLRVGLLHGRMKAIEKEAVMKDFKAKHIDILVSTTVIEVGVDVPNATVMLIEHAERFGLAQLHQLRGRVGRGSHRSMCLLLAAWTNTEDTYRRLKVMKETMDGFRIAEEDLKIRGPGDFLGTRQAGMPDFRMAQALGDLTLLQKARESANKYLQTNPGLAGAEGALLKIVLKSRWEGKLELAEIG